MYPIISTILWLIIGTICSRIARQRGRSPNLWFFLGVILGLIALIILFILPAKKETMATAPTVPEMPPQADSASLPPQEVEVSPETTTLWYYLDDENKQYGPMSFYALQEAWENDQITSATYVWNESMENWKTLEELPDDLLGKIRRTPE